MELDSNPQVLGDLPRGLAAVDNAVEYLADLELDKANAGLVFGLDGREFEIESLPVGVKVKKGEFVEIVKPLIKVVNSVVAKQGLVIGGLRYAAHCREPVAEEDIAAVNDQIPPPRIKLKGGFATDRAAKSRKYANKSGRVRYADKEVEFDDDECPDDARAHYYWDTRVDRRDLADSRYGVLVFGDNAGTEFITGKVGFPNHDKVPVTRLGGAIHRATLAALADGTVTKGVVGAGQILGLTQNVDIVREPIAKTEGLRQAFMLRLVKAGRKF
ncbi:MAG: hypothetical protein AAB373_03090 [Patescibacteria group bacterium]